MNCCYARYARFAAITSGSKIAFREGDDSFPLRGGEANHQASQSERGKLSTIPLCGFHCLHMFPDSLQSLPLRQQLSVLCRFLFLVG